MSETVQTEGTGDSPLPGLIATLTGLNPDCDDPVRIDVIRRLEELKSAAAAVQAKFTAAFVDSQRAANLAAGGKAERAERGIAHQVGLARRISPFHARRYVGWAKILTTELPATFAQLAVGKTTEWRAMIVARESIWLSRDHRTQLDAELAPRLETLGDKRTETESKKIGYRLDPRGFVSRTRGAENERRVSIRPAPDVMARLTAFLPAADAIAAHTALAKTADGLIAAGDPRSRGQLMADLCTARLTGREPADGQPVEIQLVLDPDTLLGPNTGTDPSSTDDDEAAGSEPGWLSGYGPVPGPWARELILTGTAPRWIRRMFTRPGTGELITMDSRRRLFTAGQRRFILARDQVCRTPYCEAPIRHIDHIIPAEQGGPTSTGNGGGRCVACNLGKQAPGWREKPGPAASFTITTPTGHTYRSRAPVLIHRNRHSPIEVVLDHWPHHHAA